jgi:hypothetical protein
MPCPVREVVPCERATLCQPPCESSYAYGPHEEGHAFKMSLHGVLRVDLCVAENLNGARRSSPSHSTPALEGDDDWAENVRCRSCYFDAWPTMRPKPLATNLVLGGASVISLFSKLNLESGGCGLSRHSYAVVETDGLGFALSHHSSSQIVLMSGLSIMKLGTEY